MAQAIQTLSRRTLIRGAAATIPAVALPAIALANPDAELLAMEPRILEINKRFRGALDVQNVSERAFNKWRKRNPEPKPYNGADHQRYVEQAPMTDGKARRRLDHEYLAEYGASERNWKARRDLANRQSGLDAAEEQSEAIGDEEVNAVSELALLPATTLRGLHVKARIAKLVDYEPELMQSIVDDLNAIGG